MSHEKSETFQKDDGQWYNAYGHGTQEHGTPTPYMAGTPLAPMQPYEHWSYPTEMDAIAAAMRRSQESNPLSLPSYMVRPGGQIAPSSQNLDQMIWQWLQSLMTPRGFQPGAP